MKKFLKNTRNLTLTAILALGLGGLTVNAQSVNLDTLTTHNIIPGNISTPDSIETRFAEIDSVAPHYFAGNWIQTDANQAIFNVDTTNSELKKTRMVIFNDTTGMGSSAIDPDFFVYSLDNDTSAQQTWNNLREQAFEERDYLINGTTINDANVVVTRLNNPNDTLFNLVSHPTSGTYNDSIMVLHEDSIETNFYFEKGINFIPKDTTVMLHKGNNVIPHVDLIETFDYTTGGEIISDFDNQALNNVHVLGIDTLTNDTIFDSYSNINGIFFGLKTGLLNDTIPVEFQFTAVDHHNKDTIVELYSDSANFITPPAITMNAITHDHIVYGLSEANAELIVRDSLGTSLDTIVAGSNGLFQDTIALFETSKNVNISVSANNYANLDTAVTINEGMNFFDFQLDTLYDFVLNGTTTPVGAELLFTDITNGDTLLFETSTASGYDTSFTSTNNNFVAEVRVTENLYDTLFTSVVLNPDTNTNNFVLNLSPTLQSYNLLGLMEANGNIDVDDGTNNLISMTVAGSGAYNGNFQAFADSINATYHLSAPNKVDKDTSLWIYPGANFHSFALDPKIYSYDVSFGTVEGAELICKEGTTTLDTLIANVSGGANLLFSSQDSLLVLDVEASRHNYLDKDTSFVVHGDQNEYFLIPLTQEAMNNFSFYGQVKPDSVRMSLTEDGFPNDTIFDIVTSNFNDSTGTFSENFQNANDPFVGNLHLEYIGSKPEYTNSYLDTTMTFTGGMAGFFELNKTTGIKEHQKGNFNAYPNPHNDEFVIKYSDEALDNADIGIYDMQGREVQVKSTIDPFENTIHFDTNGLSEGIYNVRSTTEEGIQYNKLIIKK